MVVSSHQGLAASRDAFIAARRPFRKNDAVPREHPSLGPLIAHAVVYIADIRD